MAEPLKNHFGPEIPAKIADMISKHYPAFKTKAFINAALDGYEPLNLMQRGAKIGQVLRDYLPDDYAKAIALLIDSLGPKLEKTQDNGMAPFLYLPHLCFVAQYGLEHFEASMRAQYELTQRFTAEWSIRPFLIHRRDETLAQLKQWAADPSVHVRRLVSEGTRPRLPWAMRLREFQKDPRPVLELLELLRDDSEIYVRRSVANNLNDIGKDHPQLLVETARRWLKNAGEERRWLVNHALRSAVKNGDRGALEVLGFAEEPKVSIHNISIDPGKAAIGGAVRISFELRNTTARRQNILADFRIGYVKSNGKAGPKVFKLKSFDLAPGESALLSKKVSLADMTTRKHFPGVHEVEALLNGYAFPLGAFELVKQASAALTN